MQVIIICVIWAELASLNHILIDWILKSTYVLFTRDSEKSLKHRKIENKKMEENAISEHLPKESWYSYINIDETDFMLKSLGIKITT